MFLSSRFYQVLRSEARLLRRFDIGDCQVKIERNLPTICHQWLGRTVDENGISRESGASITSRRKTVAGVILFEIDGLVGEAGFDHLQQKNMNQNVADVAGTSCVNEAGPSGINVAGQSRNNARSVGARHSEIFHTGPFRITNNSLSIADVDDFNQMARPNHTNCNSSEEAEQTECKENHSLFIFFVLIPLILLTLWFLTTIFCANEVDPSAVNVVGPLCGVSENTENTENTAEARSKDVDDSIESINGNRILPEESGEHESDEHDHLINPFSHISYRFPNLFDTFFK